MLAATFRLSTLAFAFASVALASASAQTFDFETADVENIETRSLQDPYRDFDGELAPGFTPPDQIVERPDRQLIRPFGEPERNEYRYEQDSPLNEFAGQRRPIERGLIGDALNTFKNGVLGRN